MFTDKVVVVTGANRGIGKAIAQAFAGQGAKVVLVAQQLAALEEMEDALLATGADVMAVPTDLTDTTAVQTLQHEIQQNYGSVDILINNAAIAVLKPLVQMAQEEWQGMTAVNLHAMFHLTQLFLPPMIERRSGVIINMSAALARNGFPNLAVYSATKAGVIAFTEAIAKEVRRYGIQAYAICPHGVNTNLYQQLFGATDPAKLLSPERVAAEVVKVAAGEAGIRSGQTLDISL
jgi:NAD(P)-dependent dehydrogenase (short-subunit alcohol dehydrogenase family)